MSAFTEVSPYELGGNYFERIGNEWMLIAARKDDRVNMMTASWGGTGILWGKPVVFAFIRPQRFTKGFVEASKGFSLTFFGGNYKKELALCGSKSGRDIDKIAECKFDVLEDGGIPYFAQADTAILCEKLYQQDLKQECFLDKDLIEKWYPTRDLHTVYVAEIKKALVKN